MFGLQQSWFRQVQSHVAYSNFSFSFFLLVRDENCIIFMIQTFSGTRNHPHARFPHRLVVSFEGKTGTRVGKAAEVDELCDVKRGKGF